MNLHPRPDDHGHPVTIPHPHVPSPLEAWAEPGAVAIVVPDGPLPPALNGIAFAPADPSPTAGTATFPEPPFEGRGMNPAAGAVVVEPDGRIWLVAPTKAFGGYVATFPKGKTEGGELRATALREVFEESGLRVELYAHLVDVTRSASRTRYYLARRTGGTPAAMGWESQAVLLAPPGRLPHLLNSPYDRPILEALKKALPSQNPGGTSCGSF